MLCYSNALTCTAEQPWYIYYLTIFSQSVQAAICKQHRITATSKQNSLTKFTKSTKDETKHLAYPWYPPTESNYSRRALICRQAFVGIYHESIFSHSSPTTCLCCSSIRNLSTNSSPALLFAVWIISIKSVSVVCHQQQQQQLLHHHHHHHARLSASRCLWFFWSFSLSHSLRSWSSVDNTNGSLRLRSPDTHLQSCVWVGSIAAIHNQHAATSKQQHKDNDMCCFSSCQWFNSDDIARSMGWFQWWRYANNRKNIGTRHG